MFNNMREAWIHDACVLRMSPKQSSRAGDTREIIGHAYSISDPRRCWAGGGRKGSQSLGYGFAELLWYLSGVDTLEMLGAYAPSYVRFTNEGRAHGAYGYRWLNNPGIRPFQIGSLATAIDLLQKNPADRRAVVSMWDSGDVAQAYIGEWNDIPCTLSLQYLIRENRLHCITTMRSNDIWLGGVYDPFTFCQLQCLVAAVLGCDVGHYHHRVGSFHMYDKNAAAIEAVIADEMENGHMEWMSPEINKKEAYYLLRSVSESPLFDAEPIMRSGGLNTALSILPTNHLWSAAALKAMHYHLNRKNPK